MKDKDIKRLVEKIGYQEGMPVVTDPGILNPMSFIKEVIEERLPNPYIPDTPQRIATDTSQKLAIRFGETIKLYQVKDNLDIESLVYIPITIAGWCRYLMGINDQGENMDLSPDPLINNLKPFINEIEFGNASSVKNHLKPILSNKTIFGLDLYEAGLGEKIEKYFAEMIEGKGSIRRVLERY
jgi:fructuronate reductase